MISILKKIFLDNWLRKLASLILAIVLWFTVSQSLTVTKTVTNIGVRILNLPDKKTIPGLSSCGLLNRKMALTVVGRKSIIEDLCTKDLEIVVDAARIETDCIIAIQKKHLISLNPEISISDHIQKVYPKNLVIKMVPLFQERIPVHVAHPIGEPPKGFQFIDVWPYNLSLEASGPEEVIKKLKARGLKLTLNLNDIPKAELEKLYAKSQKDVVSFYVPEEWKAFNIPSLSDKPIYIDDPDSKLLHIDFIRSDTLPVHFQIPIQLFVPPDQSLGLHNSLKIVDSDIVQTLHGIKVLNKKLYVKGVSELFLKMVTDMIALSVNVTERGRDIDWSILFINPNLIEDRYVSHMMTEACDDVLKEIHPTLRQEYLRNRFRTYMRRLQLFTQEELPLHLMIELKNNELILKEIPSS